MNYSVIRCLEDERTTIARFSHHDITSNNFLRTWTKISFKDYFEILEMYNLEAISNVEFSEHKPMPDIDNFCSPFTVIVTDGIDEFTLRYFVVEASD